MLILSESEVKESLEPYFGDMAQLIEMAFNDWRASSFSASMQHGKVRANVIWNQFLYHAKSRFDAHPAVRVEMMQNWEGLMVDGKYFIRMKKGGRGMLSSNYPTRSALEFNDAGVDLFDGVARLELIYGLDDLGTAIDRIIIAQRHKNKILWAIDIFNTGDADMQTVIPMPVQPRPTPPAASVIKTKRTKTAATKSGTNDGK